MGSGFRRSLGVVLGGLVILGFYFWSFRHLTESKAGLYGGTFLVGVGVAGLLYSSWRSS